MLPKVGWTDGTGKLARLKSVIIQGLETEGERE